MEEVVDRLRELNQPVPVPLDLPSFDDLVDAQEAMLIHIPDDFRDFLMQVSDVIYGSLEPATIADPTSHTYLPELASRAWDFGVERHLIPICESQGGYYVIDEQGEVTFWPGDKNDSWPSIWHWVRQVWLEEG
ncbi:SMI1/KNR4 family protein [Halioxenophilus aromaticivorans]|uniref:SMI1/KNR4 family protein n=1 Tax=Halioxenophilus aromaticivorans TaxID=1306992 RepID=A0AAV3U7P7_9ALTE